MIDTHLRAARLFRISLRHFLKCRILFMRVYAPASSIADTLLRAAELQQRERRLMMLELHYGFLVAARLSSLIIPSPHDVYRLHAYTGHHYFRPGTSLIAAISRESGPII